MKAPTALPQETLFSINAVRARALNALTLEPAADLFDPAIIPTFGDHQFAGYEPTRTDQAHRPAAVLIPVIARGDEASIILTRRASHLKDHAGQVAFPGGKIDAADASPSQPRSAKQTRRSALQAITSLPSDFSIPTSPPQASGSSPS